MYRVGDEVVYPHYGAGRVTKIEQREVMGSAREYLTIQILHDRMTVMIPVENAARVGLRRVSETDVVDSVFETLRAEPTEMPKEWSHRFKHNRDKLKTGDIFEVAEVVRNLAIRCADRDLPTGERQMLSKAKRMLASEIMYARGLSEEEAETLLADTLNELCAVGRPTSEPGVLHPASVG